MKQFLKNDSHLPPYMAYPRFLLDVDITETAKLVYMLLLDRARMSMKNKDWQDEMGRVFVLYTIPNLAKDIGKGETTVKKALNQLFKQGLILKQSLGPGQPNKIYVKIRTENSPPGRQKSALPEGHFLIRRQAEKCLLIISRVISM